MNNFLNMLVPKKVKYRKWHTMRRNPAKPRLETRGLEVSFGSHGLKAATAGRVRSVHLESARKVIARHIKKGGKMWIRVYPDKPFTAKPAEVGMGKGKGDPQGYECLVWPGRVLFEVDGLTEALSQEVLIQAGSKLPVKTRVVARH